MASFGAHTSHKRHRTLRRKSLYIQRQQPPNVHILHERMDCTRDADNTSDSDGTICNKYTSDTPSSVD